MARPLWLRARVALLCVLVARAAGYTVDCNHEYTDCDSELSKLTLEEDEITAITANLKPKVEKTTTTPTKTFQPVTTPPLPSTTITKVDVKVPLETTNTATTDVTVNEVQEPTEATETKPRGRLLNLNVDDLQNFANTLHNQTQDGTRKHLTDLSDVNLDDDDHEEDEAPSRMTPPDHKGHDHHVPIPDNFYTNLQAPFSPLLTMMSAESDTCKENGITYKVGERMERSCEEICECTVGGMFDCTPRCKHPLVRRGRRLNDPLCFESPVDECCSIIACATGNAENKPVRVEVCRYGNETHPVGTSWEIGCEQKCVCEHNSVVTCKPRCAKLPLSDKCINVQDPNDECCEVQVCDVSQDVHEEHIDNVTSSTTAKPVSSITTEQALRGFEDYSDMIKSSEMMTKATMRPLVLVEPIGSIKVLQNNSVQVNLMHDNSSEDPIHLLLSDNGGENFEDVELKYSNLILNLEGGKDYILKTKETGTKFNFTITTNPDLLAMNGTEAPIGCHEGGFFYAVGEEFHIGCSELCECTGNGLKECVDLVCPNHVGLELVSKGCVKWAPNPAPEPPNCCPRSARCLSDGTCQYKGIAIPNWSEVPISLTGCEYRCFCENGELDCQEVCTAPPPVPPQTLRCPPQHHPAQVNVSDEDCCKQWGCEPNAKKAEDTDESIYKNIIPDSFDNLPVSPPTKVSPEPTFKTATTAKINPVTKSKTLEILSPAFPTKSYPKVVKAEAPLGPKYPVDNQISQTSSMETLPSVVPPENITVFTLEDAEAPLVLIPEPSMEPMKPVSLLEKMPPQYNLEQSKFTFPKKPENTEFSMSTNFMHQSTVPIQKGTTIKNLHPIPEITPHTKTPEFAFPIDFRHKSVNPIPIESKNSKTVHKATDNLPYLKKVGYPFTDSFMHELIDPSSLETNTQSPYPVYNENWMNAHAHRSKDKSVMINYSKYFVPFHERFPTSTANPAVTVSYKSIPNQIYSPPYFVPEPYNISAHPFSAKHQNSFEFHYSMLNPDHKTNRLTVPKDSVTSKYHKKSIDDNNSYGEPTAFAKTATSYPAVRMKPIKMLNSQHLKFPRPRSLIDIVNQMDIIPNVNRNLERSADKIYLGSKGQEPPDILNPTIPFLPTIPPNIHFPHDQAPDYENTNNLHRPVHPLGPTIPSIPSLPPGIDMPQNYPDDNKKLSVISLQADSPTSIKLLFGLPPVLVGLRGSVDLRYTENADDDISHWRSQVYAPADEVLTTPRLEFRLTGLKPSTMYKIRGKLFLHNLPVEPQSDIYTVRTLDLPTVPPPLEEKRKEVDTRLIVVEVNDTVAHVAWRHFNDDELQFIDGIQVRYRPVGTPIYSMTELLHHGRSVAELHELRPGTRYEASLVLVPPPRATTELHDPGVVEFTTAPYVDPYNWSVTVETRMIGSQTAEITWMGVPSPAERWVRVYRAAHACGGARKERDDFKLATRDLPPTIIVSGLEPKSRCRVWLELFLTNGKVKTSNVLEITTKAEDMPEDIDNEVKASSVSGARGGHGDYYGALVGVGAVAALGALASLLLLLVVLRRHRPRSVPITPVPSAPRESSLPPYDNPAYKLELQQETMDL